MKREKQRKIKSKQERVRIAKEMYQKGVSIASIGMELEVGRQIVKKYLKEADE